MVGYYVQVRYPHEPAWLAIEVTEDRRAAAVLAAEAFRHLVNARGEAPTQVRVISRADLVRQGGEDAISRAAVDLWPARGKPSVIDGG